MSSRYYAIFLLSYNVEVRVRHIYIGGKDYDQCLGWAEKQYIKKSVTGVKLVEIKRDKLN